jgi:hypothetical protein
MSCAALGSEFAFALRAACFSDAAPLMRAATTAASATNASTTKVLMSRLIVSP